MARQIPTVAHLLELQRRPYGTSALGLALSAALHAALIAVAVVSVHRAAIEEEEKRRRRAEAEAPPPPPFSFVPARLLKLGNTPVETAMPQREVPALPEAPPEPEVKPPQPPNPDARTDGPRPRRKLTPMDIQPLHVPRRPRRAAPSDDVNLIWDRLRQDFPERGTWSRVEGLPHGDPRGTTLDPSLVRPGDWYATKLMEFFQERWSIPSIISPRELRRLSCKVRISLDSTFRIVEYEMVRRSGNARYDASVEEVLRKLQLDRTPLPAVPAAVREYIINNGMILTWKPE